MTIMPTTDNDDLETHPLVLALPGFEPAFRHDPRFEALLTQRGTTRDDVFRMMLEDVQGLFYNVDREKLEILAAAWPPDALRDLYNRIEAAHHTKTDDLRLIRSAGYVTRWTETTLAVVTLANRTKRDAETTLAEFTERTNFDFSRFRTLDYERWFRAVFELPLRGMGAWTELTSDDKSRVLSAFNIWAILDCVRRFEDVSPLAPPLRSFLPHVPPTLHHPGNPLGITTFDSESMIALAPITLTTHPYGIGADVHPLEHLMLGLGPCKRTYAYRLTHQPKSDDYPLLSIVTKTNVLSVEFDDNAEVLSCYPRSDFHNRMFQTSEHALADAIRNGGIPIDTAIVKQNAGDIDRVIDFTRVEVVGDYGELIQPYWPGGDEGSRIEWFLRLRHIMNRP